MRSGSSRARSGFYLLCGLILLFAAALFLAPQAKAYEFEQPEGIVSASSAILVDLDTGMVLFEENADLSLPPASTTKIMTALLVIEAVEHGDISLNDEVIASADMALGVASDASHMNPPVKPGEIFTVEQLLYAVMIKSDCAACNILGEYVSGSLGEFLALMNSRAAELGCTETNFVNAHGYPNSKHRTTARSLYLICAQALKYESFIEICSTVSYTLPPTNKCPTERTMRNSNWLLGSSDRSSELYSTYYYDGAFGVKTGFATSAGHCLVSCAERGGRTLVCVVMGARTHKRANGSVDTHSYTSTIRLFDYGFEEFAVKSVTMPGTTVCSVAVSGSDAVLELCCSENIEYLLPASVGFEELEREVALTKTYAELPIEKGEVFGTVKISYRGELLAEAELVAANGAAQQDLFQSFVVYNSIVLISLLLGSLLCKAVRSRRRFD